MNIVVIMLIGCGMVFYLGGGVGIIRMPDFYTRLHPAGKLDTMGLFLTMLGLSIYTLQEFTFAALLTAVKIMLVVLFVFITSPTATHAIADAGVRAGMKPWTKDKSREHILE